MHAMRTTHARDLPRTRAIARDVRRTKRSVSARAASSAHEFTLTALGGGSREQPTDGASIDLNAFRGKVMLVNNIASF